MADKPIASPLPADLPENWQAGQIVAPTGEEVGLTHQHGYNYLMEMVNKAQQGVNTVNDAFENVSGKRTCRFVVGTSTAGWTEADCDFLCDGTDDQVEINAAIEALPGNGGEIALLDGDYHLGGGILSGKFNVALRGNGPGTTLIRETEDGIGDLKIIISLSPGWSLSDLRYNPNNMTKEGCCDIYSYNCSYIENIFFFGGSNGQMIRLDGVQHNSSSGQTRVSNCFCQLMPFIGPFIYIKKSLDSALIENNECRGAYGSDFIQTEPGCNTQLVIRNNTGRGGLPSCGFIRLDGMNPNGGNIIEGNCITQLEILNSENLQPQNSDVCCGNIISGNIFWQHNFNAKFWPLIILGENTNNYLVTGNLLLRLREYAGDLVQDSGTDNIIRFNSDDESSGGGIAGVSRFNGRQGAVLPQSGDYTAAMVGAIPASQVQAIQALTQAEYDALSAKNAGTLYLIKE